MKINGKTKLLGVIGDPIAHSLSPVMHNAVLDHLGLNYVYLPFLIHPENLKTALDGFWSIDLQGFSVTIPHKQTIIPYLVKITERAGLIGAVNMVYRSNEGWCGTNTDIDGFLAPLKRLSKQWSQIKPIILGNGGASRAVVVALTELGCGEIRIVGRNQAKLDTLSQSWENTSLAGRFSVHLWDKLPQLLGDCELLVNTTSVGMYPKVEDCPIELELLQKLTKTAIVYDIVYTPRPSKLLQRAKSEGLMSIDGLEMLAQQGVFALQQWVNEPIPSEIMMNALLEAVPK